MLPNAISQQIQDPPSRLAASPSITEKCRWSEHAACVLVCRLQFCSSPRSPVSTVIHVRNENMRPHHRTAHAPLHRPPRACRSVYTSRTRRITHPCALGRARSQRRSVIDGDDVIFSLDAVGSELLPQLTHDDILLVQHLRK